MAINPIRIDPSRTIALRTAFIADMRRRFKALEKAIWDAIVVKDVLGLKETSPLRFNVEAQAYKFLTSDKKLESFNKWFELQTEMQTLKVDGQGLPWTNKYVESAYKKGVIRAYNDTHKDLMSPGLEFYKGSREQFLRSMFAQPERIAKLRLLYTRTFEGMKGVTARAKQEISRVLASGIANGWGPVKIAREMRGNISGLSKQRAEVIARTEIIHAHAEGQLDSFEEMGMEDVELMAEWSTAGDDKVCDLCSPRDGEVLSIDDARGQIPLHPNCRCTWIPSVGEMKKKKTAEKPKIKSKPAIKLPKVPKPKPVPPPPPPAPPPVLEPEPPVIPPEVLKPVPKTVPIPKPVPTPKPVPKTVPIPKPDPKKFKTFPQGEDAWEARLKDSEALGKAWAKTLKAPESEAVAQYMDEGYKFINPTLRGKSISGIQKVEGGAPSAKELQSYIKNLTSALDKASLPEDVRVWRGMSDENIGKLIQAGKGDTLAGTILEDKAFVSTSLNRETAVEFIGSESEKEQRKIVLEILVPKGSKAAALDTVGVDAGLSAEEAEILLQRNTKIRIVEAGWKEITSFRGKEKVRYVVGEVVQ